nr:hypothetical protein [Tanacetum cinerariifolium]
MCCQPLPPPLSSPSAKLMIMALKEFGYQSRRGIQVPKKWRSSYSGDTRMDSSLKIVYMLRRYEFSGSFYNSCTFFMRWFNVEELSHNATDKAKTLVVAKGVIMSSQKFFATTCRSQMSCRKRLITESFGDSKG